MNEPVLLIRIYSNSSSDSIFKIKINKCNGIAYLNLLSFHPFRLTNKVGLKGKKDTHPMTKRTTAHEITFPPMPVFALWNSFIDRHKMGESAALSLNIHPYHDAYQINANRNQTLHLQSHQTPLSVRTTNAYRKRIVNKFPNFSCAIVYVCV